MPDRALTGGLAYALPENRYIGPTAPLPEQEAGPTPFFSLPKENDPLAYVEGLSDLYIDTKGKIETFANDMWRKYGVDVTQPDYTQPGGGVPYKSFQKLATDLKVIANDLQASQKRQTMLDQGVISGQIQTVPGFDPTAQPINRLQMDQMAFSTQLLPEVRQLNQILSEATYDERSFKRAETLKNDVIARLQDQMNQPGISPAQRARLQFNIDAIVQRPQTTPYSAFQVGGGGGRRPTIEIDVLKKVVNDAQGKWAPGSYRPDIDKEGNPVLVNPAWAGTRAGEAVVTVDGKEKRIERVLSGVIKKADGVYFTFQNPEIEPIKVSSQAGDEIARMIIESNPKYGSVTKMYEAMRELQLADESGSVINEKLLAGPEFDTPEPEAYALGVIQEQERIKTELEKLKDPGIWMKNTSFVEVDLPSGVKKRIYKHRVGEGFYVQGEEGEKYEHMSWDDVKRYLADEGYWNTFLTDTPGVTPKEGAVKELKDGPEKGMNDALEEWESVYGVKDKQRRAVEAFIKQFGRAPTKEETYKILKKYRE